RRRVPEVFEQIQGIEARDGHSRNKNAERQIIEAHVGLVQAKKSASDQFPVERPGLYGAHLEAPLEGSIDRPAPPLPIAATGPMNDRSLLVGRVVGLKILPLETRNHHRSVGGLRLVGPTNLRTRLRGKIEITFTRLIPNQKHARRVENFCRFSENFCNERVSFGRNLAWPGNE